MLDITLARDITMLCDDSFVDSRSLTHSKQIGGRTPWESWISGEEYDEGRIYQVDPTGQRPGEPITMGETYSGNFESFAYDVRNTSNLQFFMTKDDKNGELRRL